MGAMLCGGAPDRCSHACSLRLYEPYQPSEWTWTEGSLTHLPSVRESGPIVIREIFIGLCGGFSKILSVFSKIF